MIEEITIEFGTELRPTQVSWKSQLYKNNITYYARSKKNDVTQGSHRCGHTGSIDVLSGWQSPSMNDIQKVHG